MPEPYCPEAADVVWMDFDPQSGREQWGRRPALVLSPRPYNRLTRLAVVCPITSRTRGWRFEVPLPHGLRIQGNVLSDQVKSLSWHSRGAEFACTAPPSVIAETKAKIRALIQLA